MKRKAQKFSFIMMIIFFLTGIAMTIVGAVTVGSISIDPDLLGSGSSYGYGSALTAYHPFAKFVFPTILCGLVGTFSITAVWACVLEHFNNVEKGLDRIYRHDCGKEELPDAAYSYKPKFVEGMTAPKPQQPYQPYPQQFAQPPVQSMQPPIQPIQPTVQPMQPPVAPVSETTSQAAGNWTCSNCGQVNAADANFCLGCGQKKS